MFLYFLNFISVVMKGNIDFILSVPFRIRVQNYWLFVENSDILCLIKCLIIPQDSAFAKDRTEIRNR